MCKATEGRKRDRRGEEAPACPSIPEECPPCPASPVPGTFPWVVAPPTPGRCPCGTLLRRPRWSDGVRKGGFQSSACRVLGGGRASPHCCAGCQAGQGDGSSTREGASETRSQACQALFTAPQPLTPEGRRASGRGRRKLPPADLTSASPGPHILPAHCGSPGTQGGKPAPRLECLVQGRVAKIQGLNPGHLTQDPKLSPGCLHPQPQPGLGHAQTAVELGSEAPVGKRHLPRICAPTSSVITQAASCPLRNAAPAPVAGSQRLLGSC